MGRKEINYYENRSAYKIPSIKAVSILNKTYQDDMEKSFSDQIPLAISMKKGYRFLTNVVSYETSKILINNNCNNKYINLGNGITTFGCDNNLVYQESFISYSKDDYDKRITNINDVIEKTNKPIYFYYIEKDTDINFETNKKTDVYNYLKKNINSNNIYRFKIDSFNDFKKYFYKTDHHWNYLGSYKAYTELVDILTNDKPLEPTNNLCLDKKFSGSKSSYSGSARIYKEKFCFYTFNYPNYEIKINGQNKNYGNYLAYLDNKDEVVGYAGFYGGDDGEIIFNNNDLTKKNILVFGESYDNAILKLLSSHYNKTFSIDLRNYERENNQKFDYYSYIEKNNIDEILFIGNMDFYKMEEFNLEV